MRGEAVTVTRPQLAGELPRRLSAVVRPAQHGEPGTRQPLIARGEHRGRVRQHVRTEQIPRHERHRRSVDHVCKQRQRLIQPRPFPPYQQHRHLAAAIHRRDRATTGDFTALHADRPDSDSLVGETRPG
jgi:hypothetical protein